MPLIYTAVQVIKKRFRPFNDGKSFSDLLSFGVIGFLAMLNSLPNLLEL